MSSGSRNHLIAIVSCGLLASGALAHWPPSSARSACERSRLYSQGTVYVHQPGVSGPPCAVSVDHLEKILALLALFRQTQTTPLELPTDAGDDISLAVGMRVFVSEDPEVGSGAFGFYGPAAAFNIPGPSYQMEPYATYEEPFFCDVPSTIHFEPQAIALGGTALVGITDAAGNLLAQREISLEAVGAEAHLSIASPGFYRLWMEVRWRSPELPPGDSQLIAPTVSVHARFVVGASCPADLNADQVVEDSDFVHFASAYDLLDCSDLSMPTGCPADLNHDVFVEDADFVLFASAYNALECE